MKTSQIGIDLIKEFEGFEEQAYLDVGGIPTIGYGTIKVDGVPIKMGTKITREIGELYLKKDLQNTEFGVSKLIKVPHNQKMFDSLVSFAYNVGCGALASSTLMKLLNQGKYDEVPAQFLRWNKVKGKTVKGLTRRRERESELFKEGLKELRGE